MRPRPSSVSFVKQRSFTGKWDRTSCHENMPRPLVVASFRLSRCHSLVLLLLVVVGRYMPETGAVEIPGEMLPELPFLGLLLHREKGLRAFPGEEVVNQASLKSPGILANFQANGVAVVNNALHQAPMTRLFRWLTEATIWHYTDERGYHTANFVHVRPCCLVLDWMLAFALNRVFKIRAGTW